MVLPVDQCSQHKTCMACVSEARESGCGWCPSTHKCTSQAQCRNEFSSQAPWVHHGDNFKCLVSLESTFFTPVQRLAAHDLYQPVSMMNYRGHLKKDKISLLPGIYFVACKATKSYKALS